MDERAAIEYGMHSFRNYKAHKRSASGIHGTEGIRLNIKLTNADIADMIGATRESVNRMLSAFKEDGILDMKNGKMVIRRLEDLRYVCNCPKYPACPKEICRI